MGAAVPCLSEEQDYVLLKFSVLPYQEYGTDKKQKGLFKAAGV